MGGHLLTLRFEVSDAQQFAERLSTEVLAHVAEKHGIAGVHLCETDLAVSDTRTKEREERDGGTDMPGWALLVEAARRDELDQVQEQWLTASACAAHGMTGDIEATIYRLEYVRNKTDA